MILFWSCLHSVSFFIIFDYYLLFQCHYQWNWLKASFDIGSSSARYWWTYWIWIWTCNCNCFRYKLIIVRISNGLINPPCRLKVFFQLLTIFPLGDIKKKPLTSSSYPMDFIFIKKCSYCIFQVEVLKFSGSISME